MTAWPVAAQHHCSDSWAYPWMSRTTCSADDIVGNAVRTSMHSSPASIMKTAGACVAAPTQGRMRSLSESTRAGPELAAIQLRSDLLNREERAHARTRDRQTQGQFSLSVRPLSWPP